MLTTPDMMTGAYAAELLRRQAMLQEEARQIIADLDLLSRLAEVGAPYLCGSYVTGLMVWRDLDVSVTSPNLSAEHAFEVMRRSSGRHR